MLNRLILLVIVVNFVFISVTSCSRYEPLLEEILEDSIPNDDPNPDCKTDGGLLDWVVRIGGKLDDREGGTTGIDDRWPYKQPVPMLSCHVGIQRS